MQYTSFPYQSGSGLPQESLEVSSCHQLQQDEPGHGLETHSYTTDNVLVAELTARIGNTAGKHESEIGF